MEIARTKIALNEFLSDKQHIGFVPTMGALHEGHLSLIQESVKRKLFTVASIFVNPTQFNNAADFEKYPIDTEADLDKLKRAGCELVFLPSKEELYPNGKTHSKYLHDFGKLETTIEGAYRPGHFTGVGQVVHMFFDCVKPSTAFFGQKDFQQLQVIRLLNDKIGSGIEIVGMPTVRENDGLAMSSRNRRLNPEQRQASTLLYKALTEAKEMASLETAMHIKNHVKDLFQKNDLTELEYFEIINPNDFEPIEGNLTHPSQAVIAAYVGEIRLIDNLELV